MIDIDDPKTLESLSDSQLRTMQKIQDEAIKQGIDPKFALTIANIETGGKFQHRLGNKVLKSPAGAIGVMQLMPNTAKGLKIDPRDEDENIRGGISLLKQHLDNYGDMEKAAVAYNTSSATRKKFFETGDYDVLPDETLLYLDKLRTAYPEASSDAAPAESLPDVSEELPASLSELPEPPAVDKLTGAVVGAGAGALAGSAEAGAGIYKTLAGRRTMPEPPTPSAASAGQRWKAKTGYGRGEGETVREVSEAFQRAKNKGKISSRIPVGGTLNIHEWARQKQLEEDLLRRAGQSEMLQKASRTMGKIPLGSTLAGLGAGLDVAEAAERYREGDTGGSLISGLSALGQAGTLIPHPVPRIGGALLTLGTMPADYIYQQMRENQKRKKKGLAPATRGQDEIEYDPMGNPIR